MSLAPAVPQIEGLAVDIVTPSPGASFPHDEKIRFSGAATAQVKRVDLIADGRFPMASIEIANGGGWSYERQFSSFSSRNIEAIAFDQNGKVLGKDFVTIFLQPPPVSNQRKQLVSVATSQLGRKEQGGQNSGKDIRPYLQYCGFPEGPASEWCLMFLNWCYHQVVKTDPPWGKSLARVPNLVAWAKKNNRWIRENDPHKDGFAKGEPQPGDLVVIGDYDYIPIRDNYPHIEMVVRVTATTIYTIGGNVGDAVRSVQHSRPLTGGHRYVAGYVKTLV